MTPSPNKSLREKIHEILFVGNRDNTMYLDQVDQILNLIIKSLPRERPDQGKYCGCDGECFGNCNASFNACLSEIEETIEK